jgi:hypothetical protein
MARSSDLVDLVEAGPQLGGSLPQLVRAAGHRSPALAHEYLAEDARL